MLRVSGTSAGTPHVDLPHALPASSENCAETLVELLQCQAVALGDSLAFSAIKDDGSEGARLTYAGLDRAARQIAGWLQRVHQPGERVLLLFPGGLEFLTAFFGCLYAGLVAIPAPAPEASRRKRTVPRLRAIVDDAAVTCVLSTSDVLALVRDDFAEYSAVALVDVDNIPVEACNSWRAPLSAADDVAYLQYTSGSTNTPKGVMISHRNVLHHCRDLRAGCGYAPDSISVTWLPYFHDYGLIEGLLVPLQNGTPGYVMSPFAFLRRPFAWLNAISRLRATNTQAPNFAYDQCVRRIKPDQLAQLDLRALRNAGNGAEPINPVVLEAFSEMFAPRGLRPEAIAPAYGLAEATLMMTSCGPDCVPRVGTFRADALAEGRAVALPEFGPGARRVTSCGRALGNIRIAIVDPESQHACSDGVIGEVWIADPCVALGYWRRETESEATFRAFTDTGEGPFLRTGDLGFLRDGELYVTSRIKDLIIVAGANHHPQDIEWTVEGCHPIIRCGHVAAASVIVEGEEQLIVALETELRGGMEPDVLHVLLCAVRQAVAGEHEVQIYAIAVLERGSLPKTASGKIQRSICATLGADMPAVIAYSVQASGRRSPAVVASNVPGAVTLAEGLAAC